MNKSNKGAALVSVLIAILFISLLAGSLLISSGYNFAAKSMRWSSTDNFYTAEFALADLSTNLQNIAAQYDKKKKAIEELETAVGVHTIAGGDAWDDEKVTALITKASTLSDVTVVYAPQYDTDGDGEADKDCYGKGSDYIVLYGVRIISHDVNGFESVITTDLKVYFESIKSPMDVNDFSILTDNPIEIYGRSTIMAGHVFIGHGHHTPAKTFNTSTGSYGVTALTVGGTSKATNVYLMNKALISGDVVVKSGSVLDISGEATVYGTINVEKGGSLIVSGILRTTGNVGGSGIIRATEVSDVKDLKVGCYYKNSAMPLTGIDEDRLANELLVDIKSKDGSYELKLENYPGGDNFVKLDSGINSLYTMFGTGNGLHNSLQNGYQGGVEGGLILTKNDFQMKKDLPHTTILTTGNVIIDDQYNGGAGYLTCLSDEEYEALKATLLTGSGFSSSMTGSEIVISEPDPINNKPGRIVYNNGGDKAVQAGFFINEDSASIISSAFAASMGQEDPKNTYVVYSNWDKL